MDAISARMKVRLTSYWPTVAKSRLAFRISLAGLAGRVDLYNGSSGPSPCDIRAIKAVAELKVTAFLYG